MGKFARRVRKWVHPLTIFVITLAVGLIINLAWGQRDLTGDEGDYYRLAEEFATHNRFGFEGNLAYRAPLYPLLLGATFKLSGVSQVTARILNSILAAAMATGAAIVASRISRKKWPMYAAAFCLMVNSYWWLHQVVLMQENLAGTLLAFSFVCWPMYGDRDRAVTKRIRKHGFWVVASGALFGLSQLAKPGILPLLVVFPFLSLILSANETRRTQFAFSLIFVLTSVVVISSWTVRNYSKFDRFVPITTGSGEVFWGSHAPETMLDAPGQWKSVPLPTDLQNELDEVEGQEKELRSSSLRWEAGRSSVAKTNPATLVYHFCMKVLRLWSPSTFFESEVSGLPVKIFLVGLNLCIFGLFAYSLFRDSNDRVLLLSIFVSITLTTLVFWGSIRFLYVTQPIIAGLAAQSIFRLTFRNKKTKSASRERRQKSQSR